MLDDERINVNLVDNSNFPRDSVIIEDEMKHFKEEHEGEMILNDIKLLEEMGYEKKMINKIYILLHPENIERAIDYMTEIDGLYQHNFFENSHKSKDKGLCFICKKSKRFHLDYMPEEFIQENNNLNEQDIFIENQNNNNLNNFVNNEIKIEKEAKTCKVCFDDVEGDEIQFNLLPCGHICCTNCWFNYLKSLITEAKVEQIKCAEYKCKDIISEEFILKHIEKDKKLVEKYDKFKMRANIINDPNKRQCPEPDCDSYLEKTGKNNYVKCKKGH